MKIKIAPIRIKMIANEVTVMEIQYSIKVINEHAYEYKIEKINFNKLLFEKCYKSNKHFIQKQINLLHWIKN